MPDPTAAAACVYVYPEGGVCGIAAAHHGEQLGIRTHGFQPEPPLRPGRRLMADPTGNADYVPVDNP